MLPPQFPRPDSLIKQDDLGNLSHGISYSAQAVITVWQLRLDSMIVVALTL